MDYDMEKFKNEMPEFHQISACGAQVQTPPVDFKRHRLTSNATGWLIDSDSDWRLTDFGWLIVLLKLDWLIDFDWLWSRLIDLKIEFLSLIRSCPGGYFQDWKVPHMCTKAYQSSLRATSITKTT